MCLALISSYFLTSSPISHLFPVRPFSFELRIGGKPKGEGLDQVAQLKALREDLWKLVEKLNCNPILLRLAWHDAGTYDKSKTAFGERGGANGSIRFSPEISMGANNGLDKAAARPFSA